MSLVYVSYVAILVSFNYLTSEYYKHLFFLCLLIFCHGNYGEKLYC